MIMALSHKTYRKVRGTVGTALRSGWFILAVLGISAVLRAVCYLPRIVAHDQRTPTVEDYAPLWVWSALWGLVGVFCLGCVVYRRWMEAGVGAVTFATALVGWLYLLAWLVGDSTGGYITALTYGLVVFLIMAFYAMLSTAVETTENGAPSTGLQDRGCS